MKPVRVLLNTPEGWIHFPPGEYVIGRADDCAVVLANGRVSRRHARLLVSESSALLEDLASANGTYVNGVRVQGSVTLAHDDFIVIGEIGLEIAYQSPAAPQSAESIRRRPLSRDLAKPYLPPTSQTSAADVFGTALDYALARGEPDQAERAVAGWATNVLDHVKGGQRIEDDVCDVALRVGVELAAALAKGRWLDFTLELAAAAGVVPSRAALAKLDGVIEQTGVGGDALAACTERLRSLPPTDASRHALAVLERWRTKVRRRSSPPQ